MATKTQRAGTILGALTDGTAPPAVVTRTLDAFALAYAPEQAAMMPAAEKAALFLVATRRFVRETVQSVEIQAAERAARAGVTPPDLGAD